MPPEAPRSALARLRSAWDGALAPSSRRALAAAFVAALLGGAHLARLGTIGARAGALGLALVVVAVGVARLVHLRRVRADQRRLVRSTIARVDPDLAGATLRAIGLVDRTEASASAGSPELARLHLARLVGRASVDRVRARAERRADRLSIFAFGLAAAGFVGVVVEPFRVVEGLDVLVAHDGEAPLHLAWVDDFEMTAAPPDYLHVAPSALVPFDAVALPRGTKITIRGRALHAGRRLVVTDGKETIPFLEDGSGAIVARWTLGESASLFVASQFGSVRVRQADEQRVYSIPDKAPVVNVEGAPRTVRLLDEPSISIHWEATDDHGLREVDLVLRGAGKEERRVLSRPAADATVDRGGYELRASDAFWKRTYSPIEVTVEARDNDLVTGPKWGRSAVLQVVPPQVGEPEALRFKALLKARDALTDMLADRIEQPAPSATDKPEERAAHKKHENEIHDAAFASVEEVIHGVYGGLTVKGRPASIARGQLRRLRDALDAENKSLSTDAHKKLLATSESVLLAFDAGVRGLGVRDTKTVAGRLATVVDDAAEKLAQLQSGGERASIDPRLDTTIGVVDAGGKQLLALGELGLDLGEIVAADLRRIARARQANDFHHAELAARDLAARLRKPNPSFSGGGGRGGGAVEGGSGSGGEGEGEPSDAEDQAASEDKDLDSLVEDHAQEQQEVADLLDKQFSQEELDKVRDEMKEHAKNVREALKRLPPSASGDPSSAESSAGQAREDGESMAAELDRAQPKQALEKGKEAQKSLEEAIKRAQASQGFFPDERAGREAQRAKEGLERELAWTQELVDKLRREAAKRAKNQLEKAAKDEKGLAERAKELAQKGQSGDRTMGDDRLDRLQQAEQKMREAERALSEGDGEQGLKNQEDAQRLLEMARGEQDKDGKDDDAGSKEMARKADIPDKDKHKGPEEFRKRVMEGLGGASDPRFKDAVKRYAEGLLK